MSERTYHVTGMTCAHCEQSVREEVGGVPGVQSVEVSARSGTLIVASDAAVDDARVVDAVNEAGYSAVRVA